MSTTDKERDMSYERKSLYAFLEERGVGDDVLALIQEFFEERRSSHPVYKQYPNELDREDQIPFGRHKGKKIDDPTVPRSYLTWMYNQKKLNINFPLFINSLKKHIDSESLPCNKPELLRQKAIYYESKK